jgi:GMP reductase
MRIINEVKLDFCDVLIQPKRSKTVSRSKVDLNKKYKFLNACIGWNGVPIIASNMDSTGTFAMAYALAKHHMATCLHKHYENYKLEDYFCEEAMRNHGEDVDYRRQFSAFYTLGITKEDFEKLDEVKEKSIIKLYCLDVANGYSDYFVEKVRELREKVGKEAVIMAGNVCTPEMVQELLLVGKADIVKIGIGPGSVCTTRITTGVGYPQLSAIIECADAAHGCGGHICADGGCVDSGDIVKAFAAGADFVMLGGMLSGTDECDGEWTYWEHEPAQKKAFKFYGMSSKQANEKYSGGLKQYRAAEGKSEYIPYKGPVDKVIQEITGGLRSACAYVGTDKLKDLSKCTTFVRVNRTHNNCYS